MLRPERVRRRDDERTAVTGHVTDARVEVDSGTG
jgi:hypothetical protein